MPNTTPALCVYQATASAIDNRDLDSHDVFSLCLDANPVFATPEGAMTWTQKCADSDREDRGEEPAPLAWEEATDAGRRTWSAVDDELDVAYRVTEQTLR